MILDAGFLISIDREERAAQVFAARLRKSGARFRTTHPVVAQVWRDGSGQARLARFLKGVEVLPFLDGRAVGTLLGRAGAADVVDAHLVAVAVRTADDILTADVDDLQALVDVLETPRRPRVQPWP